MTLASPQTLVPVADPSHVGEARRLTAKLSKRAGLDETSAGNAAIVVSELATNILRHAGSGELLLGESRSGVDVLAIDKGPGMDVARCLADGFSTKGTRGEGLGAVRRLSTEFHAWSRASDSTGGGGTVVHARIGATDARTGVCVGAVSVAYPGELVCGDAWNLAAGANAAAVIVIDGLGHGVPAADAARAAITAFNEDPLAPPQAIIQRCHRAMMHTRGGAIAVAHIDLAQRVLRFAGIGNIAGVLCGAGTTRGLMSHAGTVGAQMRQVRELEFPWSADAILVLHSDGLTSRWKLDDLPGIARQHPAVVAGALHRDFRRGRDDATVVVVTGEREEP